VRVAPVRGKGKRFSSPLLPLWAVTVAALLTACTSADSPTPPETRTGFPYVDAVIDAALSADPRALRSLIHLSPLPCTTREGLGGPPKCLPGEANGTEVEALPVLGSEGGHMRLPEVDAWGGPGPAELYGVYRTGPDTYSDESYPAGEFAVILILQESGGTVTLQVTRDGIVRIDYGFGPTIDEMFQQYGADFILGPFPPPQ